MTTLKVDIIQAGGKVTTITRRGEYTRMDSNLTVPMEGRYVRIKHAHEIGIPNTGLKYAIPEIVNKTWGLITKDPSGREYDYVELNDNWQWFLYNFWDWASQYRLPRGRIEGFYKKPNNFRTFATVTPGSILWVYVNMVEAHRAFTEAGSPEAGSRDVVTQRNMLFKKGYEWLCRPTGGHMAKVLYVDGTDYVLEAIDLLKPPPPLHEVTVYPWLYFWATEATPTKLPDGQYRVSNFPQIEVANGINGLPAAGIPCPFFSLGGTVRIRKSSCVELNNGEPWTPYV